MGSKVAKSIIYLKIFWLKKQMMQILLKANNCQTEELGGMSARNSYTAILLTFLQGMGKSKKQNKAKPNKTKLQKPTHNVVERLNCFSFFF